MFKKIIFLLTLFIALFEVVACSSGRKPLSLTVISVSHEQKVQRVAANITDESLAKFVQQSQDPGTVLDFSQISSKIYSKFVIDGQRSSQPSQSSTAMVLRNNNNDEMSVMTASRYQQKPPPPKPAPKPPPISVPSALRMITIDEATMTLTLEEAKGKSIFKGTPADFTKVKSLDEVTAQTQDKSTAETSDTTTSESAETPELGLASQSTAATKNKTREARVACLDKACNMELVLIITKFQTGKLSDVKPYLLTKVTAQVGSIGGTLTDKSLFHDIQLATDVGAKKTVLQLTMKNPAASSGVSLYRSDLFDQRSMAYSSRPNPTVNMEVVDSSLAGVKMTVTYTSDGKRYFDFDFTQQKTMDIEVIDDFNFLQVSSSRNTP